MEINKNFNFPYVVMFFTSQCVTRFLSNLTSCDVQIHYLSHSDLPSPTFASADSSAPLFDVELFVRAHVNHTRTFIYHWIYRLDLAPWGLQSAGKYARDALQCSHPNLSYDVPLMNFRSK